MNCLEIKISGTSYIFIEISKKTKARLRELTQLSIHLIWHACDNMFSFVRSPLTPSINSLTFKDWWTPDEECSFSVRIICLRLWLQRKAGRARHSVNVYYYSLLHTLYFKRKLYCIYLFTPPLLKEEHLAVEVWNTTRSMVHKKQHHDI